MTEITTEVVKAKASHLIDEWNKAYKLLSFWAFVAIGALPDAWAGIQAAGLANLDSIPESFKWTVRVAAAIGIYLRLVRQTAQALKVEPQAEQKVS